VAALLQNGKGSDLRSLSPAFLTGMRFLFRMIAGVAIQFQPFLMGGVAMLHSRETFRVSRERLASQCELLNDPALLATPSAVRSSVPRSLPRLSRRAQSRNNRTDERERWRTVAAVR
jgi:hypothetical protein